MTVEVLIDASQLTGQSASSGIGSYVRGLLGGLDRRADTHVTALATTDAYLPAGTTVVPITRLVRQGRPAVIEHEARRSIEMVRHRVGVFHNPNPHAPRRPTRPWVQTLFDVIPLVVDDPVAANLKRRFERFGPRYAQADRVIAISRHAADEGIRLLGIRPERITVAHLGVGAEFTPGPSAGLADGAPYLLWVSEFSLRKGLPEALAVIAALADAGHPHRLVVAGRVPPWVREQFDRAMAGAGRPDRVDVLGFVDDLPALYRGATALVMTSRYEGFGLPAVEAMACGCPVVAFANTSLPEVVGDGGILVPDGDVATFVAALRPLLTDPATREAWSGAALARAGHFDWDRMAGVHAEVYADLAG